LVLAAQNPQRISEEFTIRRDVDLVVLHTTVVDRKGRLVTELNRDHFKVYEDGVEQKLAVFKNEDIPVTVGLVLDNSASMSDKRKEMMTAALTFVETSNRLDEVFVVNFNSDYYLDLEGKDFSSDIEELKEALERTATRGSTSFYDALRASLEHIKRGTRQKKVVLVISDGVDNTSYSDFETLLKEAQQSETAIYVVGLPCTEATGRECRNAKRRIRKLAEVTGGKPYFPAFNDPIEPLCRKIAHDIRNQYILAYYPSNQSRDGRFRAVRVEVNGPKTFGKLLAHHRTGYYAPTSEPAGSQ
jgi:VWFA-related protein